MPDITMCKDSECPKRNTCYRFTAKPWGRQSYFAESPRVGDNCEYEMPRGCPRCRACDCQCAEAYS